MKGLMVTLLILSCTGMVLAQQDNNSGFRTRDRSSDATSLIGRSGGEPPVVPIVSGEDASGTDRRTSSRAINDTVRDRSQGSIDSARTRAVNSFDPTRTRNQTTSGGTPLRFGTTGMSGSTTYGGTASTGSSSSMTKPAYLTLPNQAIADLRKLGAVEAPLESPWVDRITISAQNLSSNAHKSTIEPILRGDTLVFRLTENDLAHIDEVAFQYDVPVNLQGKVRKATIEYPPALQAARSTQTVPVGSRFESDDRRWRLAGDTRERTPVRDPLLDNTSRDLSNLNDLNRQRELERLDRQRELDRLDRQREENERLAYAQMLRDREAREKLLVADQNRTLASQNLKLQEELDRLRFGQRQVLSRTQPGLYPPNRVADNSYLIGQPLPVTTPVVQPANSEALRVSMMQNQLQDQKMQQLENRLAQLANENESLRNRFDFNNQRRTDLVDHQLDQRFRTNQRDRTDETKPEFKDRPALAAGGFANDDRRGDATDSSKGGPLVDARTSNDQGWKLLMFIMLLCSVALNLYLWAVARGFYMRYEELANELRETFAVTA
jgi:hypothetical protein